MGYTAEVQREETEERQAGKVNAKVAVARLGVELSVDEPVGSSDGDAMD